MGNRLPDQITARLGAFRFRLGGTAETAAAGEFVPGAGLDQMACVYLDAATPTAKEEMLRLVLATQNGVCTTQRSAPNNFMGDTAIDVTLTSRPDNPDQARLEVAARLTPAHLTHAFAFQSMVPRREVEAFWTIFRLSQNYILTVALRGELDLASLYVVKYHVRCQGRVSSV